MALRIGTTLTEIQTHLVAPGAEYHSELQRCGGLMEELKSAIADDKTLARQILSSPVRLKAWRSRPDPEGSSAVCVDVVFSTVRVDEPSFPLTFTISFRRSETRIYLKRGSAAKIDPNSVARTEPATGWRTTQHEKSAEGRATLGLNLKSPDMGASASAHAKGSRSFSMSEEVGKILVQHMPLDNIEGYAWVATPEIGATLEGSPWRASDPRMGILYMDKDIENIFPDPVVEIIVSEFDLYISSVKMRKPASFISKMNRIKEIAVQQAISRELTSVSFEKRDAEKRRANRVAKQTAKEF